MVAQSKGRGGPWAGRAALVGFGILVALAVLEGLLRLGGFLYQPGAAIDRNAAASRDGTYRVLCLGESTTAGIASGDDAYPTQLERILNERAAGRARFEVINQGKPGTTTDVILTRLPELIEKFEPDIVVAMMGVNDGHLIDPAFQVGGSLRVWKLLKTLYHSYRSPPVTDQVEELLVRARAALEHLPATAIELASRANEIAPDDPRGSIVLAEARVQTDQIELAAESYLKAFEIDAPAVVAYSFEVEKPSIGVLDWVLSRLHRDSNALVARAVMALRRRDLAAAEYYSRRSIEIDPGNALGLVAHGHVLQLTGSPQEARREFEAAYAANPQLVEVLAGDRVVGSPALFETAVREHQRGGARSKRPATSDTLWFLRAKRELEEGLKGLHLKQSWEQIASGELEEATQGLRALTESKEDVSVRVRLRAHGQLAILAWQGGNAAEAERHHEKVEEILQGRVNPTTTENYRGLWRMLRDHGIPLVAAQYPMRSLASLQLLLEPAPDVVFVDNERVFKEALLGRPYTEIFYDLFAGDFGHMTVEGNRILADNIADAVLELVPEVRERGAGSIPGDNLPEPSAHPVL
jgi:lysophospholipase L1-like esterase